MKNHAEAKAKGIHVRIYTCNLIQFFSNKGEQGSFPVIPERYWKMDLFFPNRPQPQKSSQLVGIWTWGPLYVPTKYMWNTKSEHLELSLCVHALIWAKPESFLATFALKCSSWTPVNRGTSCRSACTSLGFQGHPSVSTSNTMAMRNLAFVWCIFWYQLNWNKHENGFYIQESWFKC